jgi:hypothetical protein
MSGRASSKSGSCLTARTRDPCKARGFYRKRQALDQMVLAHAPVLFPQRAKHAQVLKYTVCLGRLAAPSL